MITFVQTHPTCSLDILSQNILYLQQLAPVVLLKPHMRKFDDKDINFLSTKFTNNGIKAYIIKFYILWKNCNHSLVVSE